MADSASIQNGRTGAAGNDEIDDFVARSRQLDGNEICERGPWHTLVSTDAIRHFAFGTSDDNPLWLDEAYAADSPLHGLTAPPTFVCSVLYPFLHGAPVPVPLSSLIGGVSMRWLQPLRLGDRLRASARQTGVTESYDRHGHRIVLIEAETTYRNQHDQVVALASGTMVRIARQADDLLLRRDMARYDDRQREEIGRALLANERRGRRGRSAAEVWVGQRLPVFVRGPLSIGDLICWQAAIGPSYRGGSLAYRDILQAPQQAAINPVTGWPVKYSQQHEDFLLASQRGMPAPFDNSLMRFAWLAPMLTDWIGDTGQLRRLTMHTDAPVLYGDTTWYHGTVVARQPVGAGHVRFTVRIVGLNQLGEKTTRAEADVDLPVAVPAATRRHCGAPQRMPNGPLAVIDRHAESRPEAIAVECGSQRITYAELRRRAVERAAALRSQGIAPGTVVPVLLDRDVDAVITLLAILEAGCAYLPLATDVPAWQTRATLDAVGAPLLLVGRSDCGIAVADITAAGGIRIICVADLVAPNQGGERPDLIEDDSLAYVMPTSGTLSEPKLVAVPHASLATYLKGMHRALAIDGRDRCLQTAAFTFSASIRQLFLPLYAGATLVIAAEDERRDVAELWRLIDHRRITVWDTVPSIWQATMEALSLNPERPRGDSLRLIACTGEALPWRLPRRWHHELGHAARVANLYSQTETAGTVYVHLVAPPFPPDDGDVPLGRPIESTTIALLDHEGSPVADGGVGEIFVGGSRLAAGYYGAVKPDGGGFLPAPFAEAGLYRTGDLARQRPDGLLEYAGRADLRVKLRGQRVNLLDVENALRRLPNLADVAVSLVGVESGNPRLAAFVVTREGQSVDIKHLRAGLRDCLSEAALPEVVCPLMELPRNSAGKVDRKALRIAGSEAVREHDEDPTLADAVARRFAEALHLDSIDRDAGFFDLGGNSLLASVLIARLRADYSVALSLEEFFADPSANGVVAAIEDSLLREIEALSEEDAERQLRTPGSLS